MRVLTCVRKPPLAKQEIAGGRAAAKRGQHQLTNAFICALRARLAFCT